MSVTVLQPTITAKTMTQAQKILIVKSRWKIYGCLLYTILFYRLPEALIIKEKYKNKS